MSTTPSDSVTGTIVRWRVRGRVQGVGFRWFVREQARVLGVSGWVRNEPNGDVVLEAAGSAELLATLRGEVRMGPPASAVSEVEDETPSARLADELPTPFAVHR